MEDKWQRFLKLAINTLSEIEKQQKEQAKDRYLRLRKQQAESGRSELTAEQRAFMGSFEATPEGLALRGTLHSETKEVNVVDSSAGLAGMNLEERQQYLDRLADQVNASRAAAGLESSSIPSHDLSGSSSVLSRSRHCATCQGSGKIMCVSCEGHGKRRYTYHPDSRLSAGGFDICVECNGRGKTVCTGCYGSKRA